MELGVPAPECCVCWVCLIGFVCTLLLRIFIENIIHISALLLASVAEGLFDALELPI